MLLPMRLLKRHSLRFCGDEFKRNLEIKLQSLRFRKDTRVSSFIDDLYTTIKQLYDIKDQKTVTSIAMSHVINNLEPTLREEAKIFQLSGNNKLENLLEVISVKLSSNVLGDSDIGASVMSLGERNRLEKLENMVEKMLSKCEDRTDTRRRQYAKSAKSQVTSVKIVLSLKHAINAGNWDTLGDFVRRQRTMR